jgi:hypothetical protein
MEVGSLETQKAWYVCVCVSFYFMNKWETHIFQADREGLLKI